jgi:alkylated DNA nucleotide flippase Atl1
VQTRGRTVCPKPRSGARDTHSHTPVALSVACGKMGRMSEESLPPDAQDAQDAGPEYADALPEYAERVLEVAELIPPGRVMTYGDVAEWLQEGGPRQVGRVMALYGGAVPWWRVIRADGVLLPGHELRALDHYRAEGTPLKLASRAAEGHLPRIDMKRARWDGGEHAKAHT